MKTKPRTTRARSTLLWPKRNPLEKADIEAVLLSVAQMKVLAAELWETVAKTRWMATQTLAASRELRSPCAHAHEHAECGINHRG